MENQNMTDLIMHKMDEQVIQLVLWMEISPHFAQTWESWSYTEIGRAPHYLAAKHTEWSQIGSM